MKTFKQFQEDGGVTMTTQSGIAGLPPDQPPVRKKRKYKPLTRNYIEILGKRKRRNK